MACAKESFSEGFLIRQQKEMMRVTGTSCGQTA